MVFVDLLLSAERPLTSSYLNISLNCMGKSTIKSNAGLPTLGERLSMAGVVIGFWLLGSFFVGLVAILSLPLAVIAPVFYFGVLSAYALLGIGAAFYAFHNPRRHVPNAKVTRAIYGNPKNEDSPSGTSSAVLLANQNDNSPLVVEGISLALTRAELEFNARIPIAAHCPKCDENLVATSHEISRTVIFRCPCGACERSIPA